MIYAAFRMNYKYSKLPYSIFERKSKLGEIHDPGAEIKIPAKMMGEMWE